MFLGFYRKANFEIQILIRNMKYQQCTNCVMDTTDSAIIFDENGVCDHCNTYYTKTLPFWNTGQKGMSGGS